MRRKQSIGEMISTVSFAGLAVYLLLFSLDLMDRGESGRGALGVVAAACCGLGALRFVIARIVEKWRGS